jgi:hypothetical protein
MTAPLARSESADAFTSFGWQLFTAGIDLAF